MKFHYGFNVMWMNGARLFPRGRHQLGPWRCALDCLQSDSLGA